MSFNFSPKIVRDGLVLYLDAANVKSYVSGSTIWSDISTGLNDGTLENGPSFNQSNCGNIVFDGVNDYVSFSTNPNLYFTGTSQYTLSIFANIVTQPPTNVFAGIINREYGNPRNGYNFWFYKDSPSQTTIASERFGSSVGKTTFITLNNSDCIGLWNQYTVTYDGNNLSFYLNGIFKHTVSGSTGTITNTTGPLQIGLRQADYGNCKISNVQIYNKALSSTEVAQNYNTLKTRFIL